MNYACFPIKINYRSEIAALCTLHIGLLGLLFLVFGFFCCCGYLVLFLFIYFLI